MAQLNNLKSLYEHLERHAVHYRGAHRISSLFEAVYKLKEAESNRSEADRALWERWFFALRFTAGDVENWCGHITKRFDEKTYAHAAERLNSTQNPILKSRYAHILWCSPKKKIDHARIAIDSYLQTAKAYERQDRKEPHGWAGFEVIVATRNAYGLAARTKYRLKDTKAELLRLATQFNFTSKWSFRVRQELIEVILKDKQHFREAELNGLQDLCWRLANRAMKSNKEGDIQEAKDMLNLGEKIDNRLKRTSHNWNLRRGKCYEMLMQIRKEGDLAIHFFCQDAIENYRRAGKTARVKALETRYPDLAGSVQLGKITIRIDQTEVVKRGRELAEKVAKWHPQKVISFLIHQQELLPRYADIRKTVLTGNIEPILMDMPSTTIDDRGYPAQHFAEPNERQHRQCIQMFAHQLECCKLPVIRRVLLETIRNGKLSEETLKSYLQEKSWLGKTLCAKSPTQGTRQYRWLDLLEPSLGSYFGKTLQWLRDGANTPNLVLEIDSLTLKFEGILRDLLRIATVPTFRQKPDRKGRTTTEEKDLAALLYDQRIRLLFEESELFFFRFLLVEKSGCNLRARIAHSLMLADDYHQDYMHLLVLALLKLARYDLTQNNEIVASRDGSTFHVANCKLVRRILVRNRIALPNSKTARKKGYAACRVCKPEHSQSAKHPRTKTSRTQHVLVVRS